MIQTSRLDIRSRIDEAGLRVQSTSQMKNGTIDVSDVFLHTLYELRSRYRVTGLQTERCPYHQWRVVWVAIAFECESEPVTREPINVSEVCYTWLTSPHLDVVHGSV